MQLFYSPIEASINSKITLDREDSKHIVKVLRKKISDIIHITNGLGKLFIGEMINENENKCQLKIIDIQTFEPSKFRIHIAIAPTKMMDRLEWFVEKATEIGIQEISLIIGEHSERKAVKTERLHKIAISAMKQSNQFFLPKINEPLSVNDFISKENFGEKYIAHCEEDFKIDLKNQIDNKALEHTIMIGPEGDFSKNEIAKALSADFKPVSLGHTRLRTETAALVACHTFHILLT